MNCLADNSDEILSLIFLKKKKKKMQYFKKLSATVLNGALRVITRNMPKGHGCPCLKKFKRKLLTPSRTWRWTGVTLYALSNILQMKGGHRKIIFIITPIHWNHPGQALPVSTHRVCFLVKHIALDKALFFPPKSISIFLISRRKHMLWVHIRSASLRRF